MHRNSAAGPGVRLDSVEGIGVDRQVQVRIQGLREAAAVCRSIVNAPPIGGQTTSTYRCSWSAGTSVSPGQNTVDTPSVTNTPQPNSSGWYG